MSLELMWVKVVARILLGFSWGFWSLLSSFSFPLPIWLKLARIYQSIAFTFLVIICVDEWHIKGTFRHGHFKTPPQFRPFAKNKGTWSCLNFSVLQYFAFVYLTWIPWGKVTALGIMEIMQSGWISPCCIPTVFSEYQQCLTFNWYS